MIIQPHKTSNRRLAREPHGKSRKTLDSAQMKSSSKHDQNGPKNSSLKILTDAVRIN